MADRLKIYLAGKIGKSDECDCEHSDCRGHVTVEDAWRGEILGYGKHASLAGDSDAPFDEWPVLECAIFDRFDYTGPFYENGGHFMVEGRHAWNMQRRFCHERLGLQSIVLYCYMAVKKSDIVFAWLNDLTAYATLVEIGWARAMGKQVFAAGPTQFPDLWFVYQMSTAVTFDFENPRDALEKLLRERGLWSDTIDRCESPIERRFYEAARGVIPGLTPQVGIGPYRVDFAISDENVVIELDGHNFHKTKEQRTADASRERYLQREGWHVIRFTGSEIYRDVNKCVSEVLAFLAKRRAA